MRRNTALLDDGVVDTLASPPSNAAGAVAGATFAPASLPADT